VKKYVYQLRFKFFIHNKKIAAQQRKSALRSLPALQGLGTKMTTQGSPVKVPVPNNEQVHLL
jgi:hypothetical protein